MQDVQAAHRAVRKVVIAGGGPAGWVAAMALSKQFGTLLDITLVESEEIGTVGVGESTVPPITTFHNLLGIDEREFMRECAATFKVRSEEHTSELQSRVDISYAVFCLKK